MNEHSKDNLTAEQNFPGSKTDPTWVIKLNGNIIFQTISENDEANAKEFVRRCNSQPDLLEALKAIRIRISFIGLTSEPMIQNIPDWSKEIALLEAAVAKAKKGESNGC